MKKESILSLIYPEDEIYVTDFEFSDSDLSVKVTYKVPIQGYAKQTIPYVTGENYLRCFSQASYLLAHHLLENNLISIEVTVEDFLKAMEAWQLYYRYIAMTFHERHNRGEEFTMELHLLNFHEIKRLNDYVLFTFKNIRTVISGEMSFVFVK